MNWFKRQSGVVKVIIVAVVLFFGSAIIAGIFSDPPEEEVQEDMSEETETVEQEPEEKEEEVEEVVKEEETEPVEESEWDDLKNQDQIVGKSDKDFTEITDSKPSDVRNDTTGNWKKITVSESVDIEEYALSYYETHMEDEEVHHIINFTLNTTTRLSNIGGLLYVDVTEYVDKEEHDASDIGSGMPLKSYVIYPDGDIEEMN